MPDKSCRQSPVHPVIFSYRTASVFRKGRFYWRFFTWHHRCLAGVGIYNMIEALFNQPNYLAANKALDAVVLREGAISNNIANLETPGYKRVDLASSFQSELERATAAGDPQQINSVTPSLAVDTTATASSMDGNTVHLENELMQMNQNSMTHSLETQLISGTLAKLQMAITGKNA